MTAETIIRCAAGHATFLAGCPSCWGPPMTTWPELPRAVLLSVESVAAAIHDTDSNHTHAWADCRARPAVLDAYRERARQLIARMTTEPIP